MFLAVERLENHTYREPSVNRPFFLGNLFRPFKMGFRSFLDRIRSDRFLLAWNISLFSTLILPLIVFSVARAGRQDEDEGRNQEDQSEYQYDENGNYIGQKHWWQFWKQNSNFYNDQHENNQQREDGAPWWCKYDKVGLETIFVIVRCL